MPIHLWGSPLDNIARNIAPRRLHPFMVALLRNLSVRWWGPRWRRWGDNTS